MLSINEVNAPVAENLKRCIESQGLKKKTVAIKAGLTQNELSDIFGGRRVIKVCEVPALADAAGVNVKILFEPENSRR